MSMLQTLAWFSNVQPKPPVVAAAPYHSSTRRAWLHHILAGFQKGNAWMYKGCTGCYAAPTFWDYAKQYLCTQMNRFYFIHKKPNSKKCSNATYPKGTRHIIISSPLSALFRENLFNYLITNLPFLRI